MWCFIQGTSRLLLRPEEYYEQEFCEVEYREGWCVVVRTDLFFLCLYNFFKMISAGIITPPRAQKAPLCSASAGKCVAVRDAEMSFTSRSCERLFPNPRLFPTASATGHWSPVGFGNEQRWWARLAGGVLALQGARLPSCPGLGHFSPRCSSRGRKGQVWGFIDLVQKMILKDHFTQGADWWNNLNLNYSLKPFQVPAGAGLGALAVPGAGCGWAAKCPG